MSPLFTSSSEGRDIRRFIGRLLIFLLPIFILAGFFMFAMYRSGEAYSYAKKLRLQEEKPNAVVSRIYYSQQFNVYKSEALLMKKPRIITLGSSRVMQFRDFMFAPIERDFYNAGGMLQNLEDLKAYVDRVRENDLPKPDVAIIGIEPWWFEGSGTSGNTWLSENRYLRDEVYDAASHINAVRGLLKQGHFPWQVLYKFGGFVTPYYGYPAYGAQSITRGQGFRPDGSRLHEHWIADFIRDPIYKDRNTVPLMDKIKNQWPRSADPEQMAEAVEAVLALQKLGVEVQVFLPPFTTEAKELFEDNPEHYTWWKPYSVDLPESFRKAGIPCIGPAVPEDYGLDPRYMHDPVHPGEVFVSYILADIIRKALDSIPLKKVGLDRLAELQQDPETIPICFFPPKLTE